MITTLDDFLGGRIRLYQPSTGFRSGVDAILLSAFVKPKDNSTLLEIGSGTGAIALSLAFRNPLIQVTGLEIQSDLVELAIKNATLNDLGDRVKFIAGDLFASPLELQRNSFDHVVSNPPYFDYGKSARSAKETKAISRHIEHLDIKDWIKTCLKYVKPRGYISLIHRASELDVVIEGLKLQTGGINIFPLWPAEGQAAKLVLIQARKGVNTPCEVLAGAIMHKSDGSYTDRIENILRGKEVF